MKVQEQLVKAWSAIEPNIEQNALLLFRYYSRGVHLQVLKKIRFVNLLSIHNHKL